MDIRRSRLGHMLRSDGGEEYIGCVLTGVQTMRSRCELCPPRTTTASILRASDDFPTNISDCSCFNGLVTSDNSCHDCPMGANFINDEKQNGRRTPKGIFSKSLIFMPQTSVTYQIEGFDQYNTIKKQK